MLAMVVWVSGRQDVRDGFNVEADGRNGCHNLAKL